MWGVAVRSEAEGMSTITHHPSFSSILAEVGDAMGVRSDEGSLSAPAEFEARAQADRAPVEHHEPGAAASAVPVVASIGILFTAAVGLAFGGRTLIESLSTMFAG